MASSSLMGYGDHQHHYPLVRALMMIVEEDTPTSSNASSTSLFHNSTEDAAVVSTKYAQDELEVNTGSMASMILPRITAVLSIFAVICVFLEAFYDLREAAKRRREQQQLHSSLFNTNSCGTGGAGAPRFRSSRAVSNVNMVNTIQLFYQIPLFCYSISLAMGTTPVPSNLDVWGAFGNTQTCSLQGFTLQFGIVGCVLWDAALSATYLQMTRGFRSEQTPNSSRRKKILLHCIIWPLTLGASVYPLIMGMYNFNYTNCWIGEFPNDCIGEECIRGAGAWVWTSLVSFGVMLHLLYSIIIMICLYCTIRGMEDNRQQLRQSSTNTRKPTAPASSTADGNCSATAATTTSGNSNNSNRRRTYSRAVGIQGMLYTSGMILTMLPTAVYVSLFNFTGFWNEGLSVFALSMSPLVGYVNFVIFMRNRQVDTCHTRYAKFMRRMHSWLFDYKWLCKCECHCLPRTFRRRNKGEGTGRTSPTTKVPAADAAAGRPHQWQAAGAAAASPQQQQQQQHQHRNNDDNDSTNGVVVGRRNKSPSTSSSFWVQIKSRASSILSDLGLSSVGDSEFDDHWVDEAPNRPTRHKSQVEELQVQPQPPQPPKRPVRFVSEEVLPNDDYDIDALVSNNNMVSGGIQQQAPPIKPMRLETYVEADGEDDEEGDDDAEEEKQEVQEYNHQQHQHGISESKIPPCKPMRYISEIESFDNEDDDDYDEEHVTQPIHHNKPIRCISELEPLDEEIRPAKPIRCISEIKPMEDEEEIRPSKPSRHDSSNSAAMPPSRPIRYESEIETFVTNQYETPPSQPTRYVSEFEAAAADDDDDLEAAATSRRSSAPPSMPLRFESEIEAPPQQQHVLVLEEQQQVITARTTTRTSSRREPPTKPTRYQSESEC